MFNIPMPKISGEILSEGIKNLMERLMKQQEMKNEAEYRNAHLGLLQQHEAREAKSSPFDQQLKQAQINKYNQEARKAQQENAFAKLLFGQGQEEGTAEGGGGGNISNLGGNQTNNQFDTSKLSPTDKQNLNNMQPGETFVAGQNENPTQNKNNYPKLMEQLQSGQEVTIRPPSQQKKLWDRFPGATIAGIKIPDIRSNIVDGIKYDTYPSGKVIAQKVGPSDTEKEETRLNVYEQKEQAKSNIKAVDNLKKTGKLLGDYTHHIESLDTLLKAHPETTGFRKGLLTKFKAGSGESGTFQAHSMPMVGKLSKDIAERGGAVVAGMAQAGKPDLYQSYDYNIKMINEQARATYNSYKNAQENFRDIHPDKPLPPSLQTPKFLDKVRVKSPKGLVHVKTQKEAENLIQKYPSSEILGNIYE